MAQQTIRPLAEAVWLRAPVVFLLVFLALTLATSCGSRTTAKPPDSLTIVATATAAEPAPTLPDAVESQITSLAEQAQAPGDAMVRVVSSAAGPVLERDLTPLRSNGEVEHAEAPKERKIHQAVNELRRQVENLHAATSGLALLPLLDRAASTLPGSRLAVISSGVSTKNPIDFQQLGFSFDSSQVIESVVRQGLLPTNLHGRHVTFYGLGITAGTQPQLPPFARSQVQQLWLRLCQRAGGICDLAENSEAVNPPLATKPVPVVPIPTSYTSGGCPVWDMLDDTTFHFAPDSDGLPTNADELLSPIVAAVNRCALVVDVSGFIADTGHGDSSDLSGRRAHAVVNRLVQLGLDPSHVGTVVGRGTANPIVPDLIGGVLSESAAQQNRRVELNFRRAS